MLNSSKMGKFKLHSGEIVVETKRQSKIILVLPVFVIFLGIYLPWSGAIKYELNIDGILKYLLFAWTVFLIFYGIRKYLLWVMNSNLITSQRLVVFSYQSLFHKKIMETTFDRIQNVSVESKGFVKSAFSVGNVLVQIQGLTEPVALKNLKDPLEIKDKLWECHKRFLDNI